MAEEHRCHMLCANNCGLFGSPTTLNLCSTCYRDFCLKQQKTTTSSTSSASSSSFLKPSIPSPILPISSLEPCSELPTVATLTRSEDRQTNKCSVCRKRVGLTGFKCRCGTTYCGVHRYPEKHACTFDFKKLGREEIARTNPLVVADKLHRI